MAKTPAILTKLVTIIKELPEILCTVFKYPMLLVLLAFNCAIVIPLGILSIALYGVLGIGLLLLAETPALYFVVKEAIRQIKMLPMSESWETSPEKWNQALKDFIHMVQNKKEEGTKA
jgi:hypothetical protein